MRLLFLVLATILSIRVAADANVSMSAAKSAEGQWTLTVELSNTGILYSGFQMDFVLPAGITLNTQSVSKTVRTNSITMQAAIASNGLPRVVGYADAKTKNIIGNSGAIFSVQLNVAASVAAGTYDVTAKNVRFTTTNGVETVMPNVGCTLTVDKDKPEYKLTYWNDNEVYYTAMLIEGAAIPSVSNPTDREGFTFCGWGDVPTVMPAQNVDLRAVWCVNSYELKYVVDGETVFTQQVPYGNPLPEFNPGEQEGYTFCGWNDAPETMPAHDLTLTARYCVNYYELKYVVDGMAIFSEQVAYGADIPKVEAPEMDGMRFVGWEGEEYDSMPAGDVTYTAVYVKVGDVNLDGLINSADVVAIYNYIIEGVDSGIEKENADVNGDTFVNSADVTAVYNIIMYGK